MAGTTLRERERLRARQEEDRMRHQQRASYQPEPVSYDDDLAEEEDIEADIPPVNQNNSSPASNPAPPRPPGPLTLKERQLAEYRVMEVIQSKREQALEPSIAELSSEQLNSCWIACGEFLPIFTWLPKYSITRSLVGDIVAGLTVGLMAIPQGLAYAEIAGLPAQYGLYAALVGAFLYAPFGTSKDLNVGPTAILSLIIVTANADTSNPLSSHLTQALFLAFASGITQLIAGFLELGLFLDFISHPVISGFTSASALTIAMTQLTHLTKIPVRTAFKDAIYDTFANVRSISLPDTLLGLLSIGVLLLMTLLKRFKRKRQPFLWFLCIARNAIVVLVAALATFLIYGTEEKPAYGIVGNVPAGLPSPTLSQFTTLDTSAVINLLPTALLCSVIGVLETVAVAKAFARQNGYSSKLRTSQELVAMGFIQVLGSFFGAYPVSGSFSRTAVNSEAGSRTPLNGFFAGIVLMVAILFFTPAMYYVPQPTLAAVIITAVLHMFDWRLFKTLYQLGKFGDAAWWDLTCLTVSFWGCLFLGIEWGITVAFSLSIVILLYRSSRPKTDVLMPHLDHDQVTWRESDAADEELIGFASAGPSTADRTLYLADIREKVLCVRISGNLMFYSITHVIHEIMRAETKRFRDYAEEKLRLEEKQKEKERKDAISAVRAKKYNLLSFLAFSGTDEKKKKIQKLRRERQRKERELKKQMAADGNDEEEDQEDRVGEFNNDADSDDDDREVEFRESDAHIDSDSEVDELGVEMKAPSKLKALIIDCSAVNDMDTSGVKGLDTLIRSFEDRGLTVAVHFAGCNDVIRTFLVKAFSWSETLPEPVKSHFHDTLDDALNGAQREASILPIYANRSQVFLPGVTDRNGPAYAYTPNSYGSQHYPSNSSTTASYDRAFPPHSNSASMSSNNNVISAKPPQPIIAVRTPKPRRSNK